MSKQLVFTSALAFVVSCPASFGLAGCGGDGSPMMSSQDSGAENDGRDMDASAATDTETSESETDTGTSESETDTGTSESETDAGTSESETDAGTSESEADAGSGGRTDAGGGAGGTDAGSGGRTDAGGGAGGTDAGSSGRTDGGGGAGGTDSGPLACDSMGLDCNGCASCALADPCLARANACLDNPDCESVNDCLNACEDPPPGPPRFDGGVYPDAGGYEGCQRTCEEAHPVGWSLLRDVTRCVVCESCFRSCGELSGC